MQNNSSSGTGTQYMYAKFQEEDHTIQYDRIVINHPKEAIHTTIRIIRQEDLKKGRELGHGNWGVVYIALHNNEEPVAVKQLRRGANKEAKEQLLIEIDKLTSLSERHPNVVHYVGVVQTEPIGLVLEYCDSGSLESALYGKNHMEFTPEEELRIIRGAASGLQFLHEQHLIHRDIASRNVLLHSPFYIARISDFGMTRTLIMDNQQTAQMVGPLKWQAPEQIMKQTVSKESDVYSFGVLLYEVFAREAPWSSKTAVVAAHDVIAGKTLIVPARTPGDIAELMNLCFQWKTEERPTMDAIVEVFDHVSLSFLITLFRSVGFNNTTSSWSMGGASAFESSGPFGHGNDLFR